MTGNARFAPPISGDDVRHRRELADAANRALRGETYNIGLVTFAAGTESTTLADQLIGIGKIVQLVPINSQAATIRYAVVDVQNGMATIAHASPVVDAEFVYVVTGAGGMAQFTANTPAGVIYPTEGVWKDIAIDLSAAGAAASAPTLAAINGGTIFGYAFTGTATTEQLFAHLEYNHEFEEGANIEPHIHWLPESGAGGDVKWNLTYTWTNPTDPSPAETTLSVVAAAGSVAWQNIKTAFSQINGTGKLIGSQLSLRLWRDPTDAADTYGGRAFVKTFGFHAKVNSAGSRGISAK